MQDLCPHKKAPAGISLRQVYSAPASSPTPANKSIFPLLIMNTTPKNPAQPDKHTPRPVGRPANPEITKLEKTLGCTRRRAAQIIAQAEAAAPGAGADYLKLRCDRIRQVLEKSEIELAKLRAGDEDSISLREVRSALCLFLHYAQVFARRRAEEIAARPHLNDRELLDDMLRFSDASHYTGIGSALMTTSPAFAQIWEDVLREGDGRHSRGPGLSEACQTRARDAAQVILADWESELFERCQRILSENIEGHRERLVELGADPDED